MVLQLIQRPPLRELVEFRKKSSIDRQKWISGKRFQNEQPPLRTQAAPSLGEKKIERHEHQHGVDDDLIERSIPKRQLRRISPASPQIGQFGQNSVGRIENRDIPDRTRDITLTGTDLESPAGRLSRALN